MKKYIRGISAFVIAEVLACVAIGFGRKLRGQLPWAGPAAVVLGLILAAVMICNILAAIRLHGRIRTKDVKWFQEWTERLKEKAAADPKRFVSSMNRAAMLAWGYYFLLVGVVLGLNFCISAASGGDGTITGGVLLVFILFGLVSVLLPGQKAPEPEFLLSREEYPALYAVAEEAAKLVGMDRSLRLCMGGDTGVGMINKQVTVFVSTEDADLLTRHEMLQVMIHEMAHVKNEDTTRTSRAARAAERWGQAEGILAFWGKMLLQIPEAALQIWFQVHRLLSGKYSEEQADQAVKELGDPQAFVDALAKSAMYQLFADENNPEVHAMRAGEEQMVGENRMIHDRFRRLLPEEEGYWRHLLEVELPKRVDTHPIFRFRAQAMGAESYRVDRVETDESWRRDADRLLEYEDRLMREQGKERYAQLHQGYLEREKVMREFREAEAPLEHYNDQKLYEAAQAFYVLDNDTALQILDELLRRNGSNAYAQYLKGQLLLDRDDDEGAEYLFRAAENQNFVDQAMELVAVYALRHGKQELLDRYRDAGVRMSMEAIDYRNEVGGMGRGEKAVENDLPPEKAKEVLDYMVSRGEGKIAEILTVKKLFGREHSYQYYVRFKKDTDEDAMEKIMDEIFLFLDMEEESFALDIPDGKLEKRLKKKVPGCSVYRDE